MATKVDCNSYLPGYYYSMRDLNEDSSSSSWPTCYGDKASANGQYYNGFMPPRTMVDGYPGYEKDALKQKMLEHEAIFRNQVYELHRLYRVQRDMMEEFKRKELHRLRASLEQPSSSSSLKGSQMPSQDASKWHMVGFPLLNSDHERASMSRVEIEDSPVSCTKGYSNNTTQSRHFPFQNGSSLKESEPSDSRPLTVRKKLFDLQLLAGEYIDTDEGGKLPESKVHSGSIRMADLNKPVEIEKTMAPSTVDFLDRGFISGEKKGEYNQLGKWNAGYLGVNGGSLDIRDGSLFKSSVGSIVNERGWFSHLYGAGSTKNNLSSVTRGLQKEKMPIPSQPVPVSDPFFSSCFSSSWSHPIPSWTKLANSITQKLTTAERYLDSPAATDRNLQTKAQIGGNRLANGSSYLDPLSGGELMAINGFYHGPASGSKETKAHLLSARLDYANCSRADNIASDRSTNHALGYSPKGDLKPAIDINLNEAEDGKREPEDHLSALPWLKRKPREAANQLCCKSQTVMDLNQPFNPKVSSALSDCEIVSTAETQNAKKILGIPIFETGASQNMMPFHFSTSTSIGCPENVGKEKKNRIIDINLECDPDDEASIAELTVEKEKTPTKGAFVRDYIDLNACISDFIEEDALAPSYESKAASVKISFELDLEAPVENEDDMVVEASLQLLQNENETLHDEILKNAAEIMVTISSSFCPETHSDGNFRPLDASLAQSLMWFANQLETNESTVRDGPPREEVVDDFEAMTLQIQETREEDYMPSPFVPEFQKIEGTGPATNNNNTLGPRSRRGQSRRGRPRRDFQRDILPGLVSLSRHEVTEDIQMFGGLMRATGHHWVSGLTRRNGGSRGRRRAVIESVLAISGPNNQACTPLVRQVSKTIDSGLEDRSLTGWGKTTRRPRRQRCPAGNNISNNNPPAVVLT